MNHIVERLLRYGEFDVVVFSDNTILTKPVDEWPLCGLPPVLALGSVGWATTS